MSNKKTFGSNFSGKGYYIALILCAAAIGISGYFYYRNADGEQPSLQDPTSGVDIFSPTEDDMQAVATHPTILPGPTEGNGEATKPTAKPFRTCSPLSGTTVADYAMDCLSYNQTTRDWRTHNGVDITAAAGTAVCAAADGTVYTVYPDETMGTTVVIRHDGGYVTMYSSLAETVTVKAGDRVVMGQTIGQVGNTALLENAIGDHVHFSVTWNDKSMDPAEFLKLS